MIGVIEFNNKIIELAENFQFNYVWLNSNLTIGFHWVRLILNGFCLIVYARKRSMFKYIAKNFNSTFLFYLNKSNTCKEHSYLIMVYLSKESCTFPCMVLQLFWCFVAFLAWFWVHCIHQITETLFYQQRQQVCR